MRLPALLACSLVVTACERGGPSGSPADSTATPPIPSAAPVASAETTASALPVASAAPLPSASAAALPDAGAADAAVISADPSRLTLEGRPVQGGLLRAKLNGKLGKMNFPGHRAIVSDEGEFLIVFGRNAPKQEKLTITFDDGQVLERLFDVEQRTYETDKIDNLPKEMVELDMPTRVKLTQAEQKLDAVRKKYTKKNCTKDAFVWPTKGKVTSRYGQPRVLNGTDGGIHWGVDIAVPTGTPVRAPACGTVVFAEKNLPLSGDTLLIDHGYGLTSTFIHLGGFSAKVGDEVKQGQVVARVGMSGRTNGPHLDWRMNFFEVRIDPELMVGGEK